MILRVITVLAVFTVADGLLPLLMANCKYEHKGCFKDTKNRAIDSIGGKKEFHRSVLVEQCRQLAMRLRHSLFGAESEDECFTGHIDYKENKQYDRYGPKTSCAKDGTGGGWAIDVYKITCEDLVKTWLTNGWKVPTLNSRKEIDLADQALQLRMSNPRIENARIQIRFLDADGNSPGADEHVGVINFYITEHVITFGGYCGEIVLPKRSPETKFKGSYRWGDLIEIKVTGDGMEVSAAGIIQVVDSCKDLTDALKNIATFTFEYYDKEEMDAWHYVTVLPCRKGHYKEDGMKECSPCPENSYSDKKGSKVCETCTAGHSTDSLRSSCEPCKAGSFKSERMLVCSECQANKYSLPGADSCIVCGKGEVANEHMTGCVMCAAGRYRDDIMPACQLCPENTYSNDLGATACLSCPAGQVSIQARTGCESCVAGSYRSEDISTCAGCPGNSYSTIGATSCAPCGPGKMVNGIKSGCIPCEAGTYRDEKHSTCVSCQGNTYSHSESDKCNECLPGQVATKEKDGCQTCERGTYRTGAMEHCLRCDSGTVSSGSGATKCTPCQKGRIPDSHQDQCVACKAGTFLASSSTVCMTCLGNKFSKSGSVQCSPCPPGTEVTTNRDACTLCAPGQYREQDGERCKSCPIGQIHVDSRTYCVECEPGHVPTDLQDTCRPCRAGMYRSEDSQGCIHCPDNTYSGPGSGQCTRCAGGSVHNANKDGCEEVEDEQFYHTDNESDREYTITDSTGEEHQVSFPRIATNFTTETNGRVRVTLDHNQNFVGVKQFQFIAQHYSPDDLTQKGADGRALGPRDTILSYEEANEAWKSRKESVPYFTAQFSTLPDLFYLGDGLTYGTFYNGPLDPDREYTLRVRAVVESNPNDLIFIDTDSIGRFKSGKTISWVVFGLAVVGALVFVGVWGMTRKKKSDGSEQPLLEEEDEWAPIGGANPGVRDRIRSKVVEMGEGNESKFFGAFLRTFEFFDKHLKVILVVGMVVAGASIVTIAGLMYAGLL